MENKKITFEDMIGKIKNIQANVANGSTSLTKSLDPTIQELNQGNQMIKMLHIAGQQGIIETVLEYVKSENSGIIA